MPRIFSDWVQYITVSFFVFVGCFSVGFFYFFSIEYISFFSVASLISNSVSFVLLAIFLLCITLMIPVSFLAILQFSIVILPSWRKRYKSLVSIVENHFSHLFLFFVLSFFVNLFISWLLPGFDFLFHVFMFAVSLALFFLLLIFVFPQPFGDHAGLIRFVGANLFAGLFLFALGWGMAAKRALGNDAQCVKLVLSKASIVGIVILYDSDRYMIYNVYDDRILIVDSMGNTLRSKRLVPAWFYYGNMTEEHFSLMRKYNCFVTLV